ncbi:MAG TPA: hypothetical protein DEP69_00895 [Acidimicrobiaceae bacterium]|nr:hypothetical protein [Acidimicrobiaceae bacterium]
MIGSENSLRSRARSAILVRMTSRDNGQADGDPGRIDITLDDALVDDVAKLAVRGRRSMSAWLVRAAERLMEETGYEIRHYRPWGDGKPVVNIIDIGTVDETPADEPAQPQ